MPNNKKQQRKQQQRNQQRQRQQQQQLVRTAQGIRAAPDQGAILFLPGVARLTGGREEFNTNDVARFLANQEAAFAREGDKLAMCRWIWNPGGIGSHSLQDCRSDTFGWNEYWKDEKKKLRPEPLELEDAEHLGEKWFSIGIPRENHPENDPLSFMLGLVMRDMPRETYWFKSKKNRDALAAWLTA
jgi:hypothetical protein